MRLVKAEERVLDGLYAYDRGATDSGIHDPAARARMAKRVAGMSGRERAEVARSLYGWQPYAEEDVDEFRAWLDDLASEVTR